MDTKLPCIEWLESEYPHGLDLIYIDYRDSIEDMNQLQEILKTGYAEKMDDWTGDAEWDTQWEVMKRYMEKKEAKLTDDEQDKMREWMWDHNTSDPLKDLLRNTDGVLCYIDTGDYSEEDKSNLEEIVKKYATTDEQKKEIEYVISEQFYGAPVGFYFKINPSDAFKVLHNEDNKDISIDGAYFGTVDRLQGSNWLGEKAIFRITMPRDKFIENFFVDAAKGNGYGWNQICGGCQYDDAGIVSGKLAGAIEICPEVSESQIREQELDANYRKTGKCTFGDMNISRHKDTEYINNVPCGTKCKDCSTFWID